MLFLSEVEAGKAWEHSYKELRIWKLGALGISCFQGLRIHFLYSAAVSV
jgi:hypothetical protein